jgi:hypothetical protein
MLSRLIATGGMALAIAAVSPAFAQSDMSTTPAASSHDYHGSPTPPGSGDEDRNQHRHPDPNVTSSSHGSGPSTRSPEMDAWRKPMASHGHCRWVWRHHHRVKRCW